MEAKAAEKITLNTAEIKEGPARPSECQSQRSPMILSTYSALRCGSGHCGLDQGTHRPRLVRARDSTLAESEPGESELESTVRPSRHILQDSMIHILSCHC